MGRVHGECNIVVWSERTDWCELGQCYAGIPGSASAESAKPRLQKNLFIFPRLTVTATYYKHKRTAKVVIEIIV